MIRFFIGLVKTIVVDVITTIITMYERSVIGLGATSRFAHNGYCISNIKSQSIICERLILRLNINTGYLHIDLQNALISIPANIPHNHNYPSLALELINHTIQEFLFNRIRLTGDHIQLHYQSSVFNLRHILYKNNIGALYTSVTLNNYSVFFYKAKLSRDLSLLSTEHITIISPLPTQGNSESNNIPLKISSNTATIIFRGRPSIRLNARLLSLTDKLICAQLDAYIARYKLLTISDIDMYIDGRLVLLGAINIALNMRKASLINRILSHYYPAKSPNIRNIRRLHSKGRSTGIHINHDYLKTLSDCSDTDSDASTSSSSILKTQITMINEYINANPYASYIPIVDKSIKNSEITIGSIGIDWGSGSWLLMRFRLIDQQDSTYADLDDFSIHHTGTFHASRVPASDRRFICRLRKPTNQLVISPAPIYINSDISASDFPEADIIRRCIGGLDTGGGTMYSQISIEGYHLLLNIHTEITIGQIDIRDADLNIGGWLIWCPANWKEVATKYEAHIKEQIYKDENMKALLGLSSIGTIISVIESITSWAMRIRQK